MPTKTRAFIWEKNKTTRNKIMEKTTVGLCINKMWQIQKKISSGHFIKHKPLIFLKI